jgi:hypothetical protein
MMTEKEIADRLRDIADNAADADVELRMLADELDPRPEPGTAVWFTLGENDPDPPELGIVTKSRVHVIDADGFVHSMAEVRIKPARVLGPRQVAVDVPPVAEWGHKTTDVEIRLHWWDQKRSQGSERVRLITRAEAMRMEANDD